MAAKNDVLEIEEKVTGLPTQEKVLMSQEDLISGLLAASDYETDDDMQKLIQVKRNGKVMFEFMVRPLSEKEMVKIRKSSTLYYKNPAGKHLPKIEGDLKVDEYRSKKIYEATTDEYKEKLWDNPQVKASLNAKGKAIMESWEVISAVLMAGEKYAISEKLDDISGFDNDQLELEEYAKN